MIEFIITLLFIVAPIGLTIHEMGHTGIGLFSGSKRSVLTIGLGPPIIRIKLHKLHIIIHALYFFGGYSSNEKNSGFSPLQKILISLGGPLANGLFASFLIMTTRSFVNEPFIDLLIMFNLYLAVINLVPFRLGRRKSDGYRVLQTMFRSAG
ncbi:site-2 protease family protein [Halobacillus seohaensis]|uniref:Site-2 protease family protein n=1 Tax=Halobacillus seohaensis TaxID=447421 RepID=A0ABW2EE69_9BACI